ncbi:hypothetical protein DL96DRAFT_1562809 [Flagelloscypha sp. PMI_526]|nr:hypothetical protein DL96DRAFT_1562809 [Flagelloscypha sp. PMI_526]
MQDLTLSDHLPQLPNEILAHIVAQSIGDQASLRNACLANSTFKSLCFPLLFSSITLDGLSEHLYELSTSVRMTFLLHTTRPLPLVRNITRLVVTARVLMLAAVEPELHDLLPQFLAQCVNATSLGLIGDKTEWELVRTSGLNRALAQSLCPILLVLELQGWKDVPLHKVVWGSPCLHSLTLGSVKGSRLEAPPQAMRVYDGWLSLQALRIMDGVNHYVLEFLTSGRRYYPLQQLTLDRLPSSSSLADQLAVALENYGDTLQHFHLLFGIDEACSPSTLGLPDRLGFILNTIFRLNFLPSIKHLEFSLTLREDAPDIQWIDETIIFRWLASRFDGFDDHPLEQVTFNVEVSHHCQRESIPDWSNFDILDNCLPCLKLIAFKFSFQWEDVDHSCFLSHTQFLRKALPHMNQKGMLGFWVSSS